MAKARKKSKGALERRGKKEPKEKLNPFEIKINRQKHNILGRKLSKHDVGMPGLSRYKATQKRADTLLVEYKKRWKSGRFVDKRFAENDPTLSLEEKMLKRFALEKQKTCDSVAEHPLNEEELTHYGQSLASIEKFDDTIGSSDDEEDRGKISAKLVAEEHFGGGVLSNVTAEQGSKTWKERMEEVIMQSKKAKYERQMEKEKALDLTERLDGQWKELRTLLGSTSQKSRSHEAVLPESKDSYDAMVRLLRFESRGHATDRLKSEEELAKEEKLRLEKLEKDRLRRMKGVIEDESRATLKHRSADDLDDGFSQPAKERFHVSYKDGRLLTDDNAANAESLDQAAVEADGSSEDEGEGSDEEGENSDEEDENSADEGDGSEPRNEDDSDDELCSGNLGSGQDEEGSEDEDANHDAAASDGSDSDDDSSTDDGDVITASEDEAASDDHTERGTSRKSLGPGSVDPKDGDVHRSKEVSSHTTNKGSSHADFASELRLRKAMMDAARQELPYTFSIPSSYGDLASLLCEYSAADQLTVLTRMRKCNHESLAEGNKERLQALFGLLLEYFGDVALQEPLPVELLEGLTQHLFELNKLNPLTASLHVLDSLSQRQTLFSQYCRGHGGFGPWPRMDVMFFFKLIGILYPTSDYYHPVVTPVMVFMSQIFGQCSLKTYRDIVAGLYMAIVAYEYISFAKRYCPELVNLLVNVLWLALPKKDKCDEEPMFRSYPANTSCTDILTSSNFASIPEESIVLRLHRLGVKGNANQVTDGEKLAAIRCALDMVTKLTEIWKDVPAFQEVFATMLHICKKLSRETLPEQIKLQLRTVVDIIEKQSTVKRDYLSFQKRKPKLLRTYEPAFEEIIDGKKKKDGDRAFKEKDQQKAFNEKQRLIHKHKKELKGAMREVRKDARFLAQHKLQEQLQRDTERKRKVKELYQSLSQQEGDFRALKRGRPTKK